MNTVMIIQARMTSTRLPGKLLPSIHVQPLLNFQIERLRCFLEIDRLVISTTTNASDDAIVAFCAKAGIYSRDSVHDVLSRYRKAAQRFPADTIVRVNSDCPLLEPAQVNTTILHYRASPGQPGLRSNMLDRTNLAVRHGHRVFFCPVSGRRIARGHRFHRAPTRHPVHLMAITTLPPTFAETSQQSEIFAPDGRHAGKIRTGVPHFRLPVSDRPAIRPLRHACACTANPDWLDINRHIVEKPLHTQNKEKQ